MPCLNGALRLALIMLQLDMTTMPVFAYAGRQIIARRCRSKWGRMKTLCTGDTKFGQPHPASHKSAREGRRRSQDSTGFLFM